MRLVKKVILDEDPAKVGGTLRRTAARARKIAEQTHTPLVICERGRLIRRKVVTTKNDRPRKT